MAWHYYLLLCLLSYFPGQVDGVALLSFSLLVILFLRVRWMRVRKSQPLFHGIGSPVAV